MPLISELKKLLQKLFPKIEQKDTWKEMNKKLTADGLPILKIRPIPTDIKSL